MVYDDIDGLEEMLLDLSNVSLFSHFEKKSFNEVGVILAIFISSMVQYDLYILTGREQ